MIGRRFKKPVSREMEILGELGRCKGFSVMKLIRFLGIEEGQDVDLGGVFRKLGDKKMGVILKRQKILVNWEEIVKLFTSVSLDEIRLQNKRGELIRDEVKLGSKVKKLCGEMLKEKFVRKSQLVKGFYF